MLTTETLSSCQAASFLTYLQQAVPLFVSTQLITRDSTFSSANGIHGIWWRAGCTFTHPACCISSKWVSTVSMRKMCVVLSLRLRRNLIHWIKKKKIESEYFWIHSTKNVSYWKYFGFSGSTVGWNKWPIQDWCKLKVQCERFYNIGVN